MAEQKLFDIRVCEGILNRKQLEVILQKLPIDFYTVEEGVDRDEAFSRQKPGIIEVYHKARVISLYPQEGERLSNANVRDWDFPFRPDNIMDDNLGLRCCYHPRLTSFGLPVIQDWDEIEIDVHKFSKNKS